VSDLPEMLLVPVDGSSYSNAAAAYAARLAERLGTPVRLLHAFPETPIELLGIPTESPSSEYVQYFSPEGFEKFREESAASAFGAPRAAIGETAVALEERIIPGDTGQAILDHAAGMNRVMIIMGRRGASRFREIMIGSTTQQVLHHARCPVLVIR